MVQVEKFWKVRCGDIIDDRLVDGGSVEKKQSDSGGFAKLFVGCVPKTATEQNIRPTFGKHGNVVEVAMMKDKRTAQAAQQQEAMPSPKGKDMNSQKAVYSFGKAGG
ncbi:flowering time control protein FCA isoform X2 [Tanacetum coccineum]